MIFLSQTIAQSTVLDENVDDYTVFDKKKFGPNGKHYTFMYYSLDFYTPSIYGDQTQIFYGQSYRFSTGMKYKFQLTKWLSTGTDLNYSIINYNMAEKVGFYPIFYGETGFFDEKIVFNNLGTEVFMRFFIGKRGNTMGKYIDIAGFGFWSINNRAIQKFDSMIFGDKTKIVLKNIDWFNKYNYGAMLRFGYKFFAVTMKYRISDLRNEGTVRDAFANDFPKFTFGIEFAMVQ